MKFFINYRIFYQIIKRSNVFFPEPPSARAKVLNNAGNPQSPCCLRLISSLLVLSIYLGWGLASPSAAVAEGSKPRISSHSSSLVASLLSQDLIHVAKVSQTSVVNITSLVKNWRALPAEPHPFFDNPILRKFLGKDVLPDEVLPLPDEPGFGMASGVIISSDGYIVTNYHVAEQAGDIRVLLADQRDIKAQVIGMDPMTDLAVIKIEATGLSAFHGGNSNNLQVGEIVIAVGNPFGLNQTVIMGIVSAVGRDDIGIGDYVDFIQTDAAINPGNSGGPLLNLDRELIAINSAIFSETGGALGIGFAIPSQMAKSVTQLLIKQGKVIRGWLGVTTQSQTSKLAAQFSAPDTQGVLITEVADNGPAGQAKFQRGDIIQKYNGQPVTDLQQLRSLVADTASGKSIPITRIRDGGETTVLVKIAEFPYIVPPIPDVKPLKENYPLAGVMVERPPTGLARDHEGVMVSEVVPGSLVDRN